MKASKNSIILKTFLSDVRVNALLEINLHKMKLLPCYEKFDSSLSPLFNRFLAQRFQNSLLSLKKESQPIQKTKSQIHILNRTLLDEKSFRTIGTVSRYTRDMLKKIKTENEDFNHLMSICTVNIEQQKLLEEMHSTFDSYRRSRIEHYLGKVS